MSQKPHIPGGSAGEAYRALEQQVEDRTRELSTLLQVSRQVSSMASLEPLLDVILDKLKLVVEYTGAWIFRLDGDELTVLAHRGPVPQEEAARVHFLVERARIDSEVVLGRRPLIIADTRADDPLARSFRESDGERLNTTFSYIRSWMGVPVMVKERVIGKLTLDHCEPNRYSSHDAALALAFAEQAGLAMENARLRAEAEENAVAAERNRLARDLHDAVTQTLFSASLIAEVLPRLWERNPEEGRRRLSELRELTRGALAEMRTLLLELRPSVLREASLGLLLRQLSEATTGRARVPVSVEVDDTIALPPEVQIALYRIAQEALNNVAKHSQASHASVTLEALGGQVKLRVSDDGKGFAAGDFRLDSLGLGIMRERAQAIGAALSIDSKPGHGTQVTAVWQNRA